MSSSQQSILVVSPTGKKASLQPFSSMLDPNGGLELIEGTGKLGVKTVTPVFAKTVYVNSSNPNTATVFTLDPDTGEHTPSLATNTGNLYIATDQGTWFWTGTEYRTKIIPPSTAWNTRGTTTDAGASKTTYIHRQGFVGIGIDKYYGAVTVKGGAFFDVVPEYNVASIGRILYAGGWLGTGGVFSNSTHGTGAFSFIYNYGRVNFACLLPAAQRVDWGCWADSGMNFGSAAVPTSTLQSSGSFSTATRVTSVNTTTTDTDSTIVVTAGGVTVTLKTPAGFAGRRYVVKNWAASTVFVNGLVDGTVVRTISLPTKQSLEFQSDGNTWNIVASYNGEYAVSQQASTGAILEGTRVYYMSDGNFTSPLVLPGTAPYVGFELMLFSHATLVCTISNTNTSMSSNLTLTTGKSRLFKWFGNGIKWVDFGGN